MKFRWSIAPAQPVMAQSLARELKISPLLAQCLLNRGFTEGNVSARFLEPRLQHLADPFLLPDMEKAVQRLFLARERNEAVVIFGDYDADGVTATALLSEVMDALGWKVHSYLPHRIEEGYGLSRSGVENCLKKFPTRLLLAVDCGSTSGQTIDWLGEQGVDVLVLDHHQVSNPAPKALALINPRAFGKAGPAETSAVEISNLGLPQTLIEPLTPALAPSDGEREEHANGVCGTDIDSVASANLENEHSCAFGELCSAGLAFKLAHALVKRGRELGMDAAKAFDLRPCLDLVALGTIADLVPLVGENRILVCRGLERLNCTQRPGLLALKQAAGISGTIGGYEVAFQLAPRLNAAGRLETALDALHLLQARDLSEARPLAQRLDAQNRERQEIERKIVGEVVAAVRSRFNPAEDYVIVEGQTDWHVGVVGIVATRVLQEFCRPAIILGGDAAEWRGSGRSIAGFDLAAALRDCHDLLLRHGGHAMAAGLALHPEKLDHFRRRLNELARGILKPEQFQPSLRLDAEVTLDRLTFQQVKELERLQQTGMGNPPVHLLVRNLAHQRPAQRLGPDKKHAKIWVTDGVCTREAVIWGLKDRPLPEGRFDLAFTPQLNAYNGRIGIQLKVLDWMC